ncbi:MAG: efflux RND transporter permease subunit, partial [Nitrosomonas sp.]|nr:efflux RND transporter permease subunit [Nitrosomonas sp.]
MKLIIWFARNPIAANFLMLLIIAGGLFGLNTSKKYTFPPEPQNQLQILAAYPGAGPGEVEQALCIPIEEAIHELEGIRHINSVANQTECEVTVEFDPAIGAARFQAAIKAKIDTVKTFPKEIERLNIQELKTGTPAVIVVIRGDADLLVLQQQRDQLKALLSKHRNIGYLSAWPQYPREISIEITESDLRRYRLDFEEISEIINNASKNIPAGELKKTDGKLLLRSKGQGMSISDFAAIELRPTYQGARLLLGDVAKIRETLREEDLLVRVDDKPAMQIIVMPKDQIKATVEAVNQIIAEFRPQLPPGVE